MFAVGTGEVRIGGTVGLDMGAVRPERIENGTEFAEMVVVPGDVAFQDANGIGVETSEIGDGYTFLDGAVEFAVYVLQDKTEIVVIYERITMGWDGGLRWSGMWCV